MPNDAQRLLGKFRIRRLAFLSSIFLWLTAWDSDCHSRSYESARATPAALLSRGKHCPNLSFGFVRSLNQRAIPSSPSTATEALFFGTSAERAFGYSEEEILGQPLTLLMSERDRAAHLEGMKRFMTTGEARVIGLLHGA